MIFGVLSSSSNAVFKFSGKKFSGKIEVKLIINIIKDNDILNIKFMNISLSKEIKKQSTPPEDHKQNIDKIKNDCLELTRQKKYHDVILNQYAFDAFQVIDNNWLFKYKINKFFEYINISLFCMVLNTWIANFFKFTSLDWNSLIVISLNYFIVGLFPLTSPLYKNHGCIRISLLIIWIITVFLLFKR